jgi:hypothetical protein
MGRVFSLITISAFIVLLFAGACVTKNIAVKETYYETELRQQQYTTTETYEYRTPHKSDILLENPTGGRMYLLMNKSANNNITWAVVTGLSQSVSPNNLVLVPQGKYQRFIASAPIKARVSQNRTSISAAMGFSPNSIPSNYAAIIAGCQKTFAFLSYDDCLLSAVDVESQYGFTPTPSKNVDNATTEGIMFDDLFKASDWSLLCIYSEKSYSLYYVWDEVEMKSREVTKTRDISVPLQKQRMVNKSVEVPFWEAIIGKQ